MFLRIQIMFLRIKIWEIGAEQHKKASGSVLNGFLARWELLGERKQVNRWELLGSFFLSLVGACGVWEKEKTLQ